jgi:hypothetical protein
MTENSGFDNILGFGDQAFTTIVLVLTAGISAHICYGYGTKKAKELFIGLILLLMVSVQLYHLVMAAVYMPATRFYVYNVSKFRRVIFRTLHYLIITIFLASPSTQDRIVSLAIKVFVF